MANPLENKLKKLIAGEGAISIAQFMQLALFDAEEGYYTRREIFGEFGDFITAPEISQIFGEIMGSYAAYKWQELGSPENFQIIELGPGRGALLNDFLRATQHIPKFHAALHIALVELSPRLIEIQAEILNNYQVSFKHHQEFAEIASQDSFIIANEFFDALPINQYQYQGGKWHERKIALNEQDEFNFVLEKNQQAASEFIREPQQPVSGDIYEISFASLHIMDQLAEFLSNTKSIAVLVDYGYAKKQYGDSLQALKKHQYHEVFKDLGHADLTAHVDFSALVKIAGKYTNLSHQLLSQAEFLLGFGASERHEQLKQDVSSDVQEKLDRAFERLTHPEQMGELFKVLLIENSSK